MNSDLEEIKNRLNVVDVLGEYIRLEKTGTNYRALCPFHNEKSPSFMVSEEKQIWHCFGCQKGGDIFSFVMEMEGLEFREALKLLAEKAGVKLANFNPQKAEQKNRTMEILELATKWYEHQLWSGPGKIKILNYLHERGLSNETIKEFRLGYAPRGWRNILTFLAERGFKPEEIMKTGLLVKREGGADHYDRFRGRIMFPIADYSGKIVGYSARVAPGQDESQAKYVNTPETEVYHKSKILYGIDKAKGEMKQKDFVLMVEGNMDVIAAHQAGIKNTVAVSGTALTDEQLNIVKRYAPKIKMFFDMDSAGEQATKKSLRLCFSKDIAVEVVALAHGKDAADLARENPEELRRAVDSSQNAMGYILGKALSRHDKKKVEDKKNIAENVLEMIHHLGSAIEKSHWIKKLGEELETSESALTDMLKKVTLKDRIGKREEMQDQKMGVTDRKKADIIKDEIIGLMLVYPEVWKHAEKNTKDRLDLLEDSLIKFMLENGLGVKFDFDELMKLKQIDPETRARAEKLFLQKKFRLGINNNIEEIIVDNPQKEFDSCLQEMEKENRKERLSKITRDLKIAEEKKDKKTAEFLRQEFSKISQELMGLNK